MPKTNWTREQYDCWKELWEKEHPNHTPPNFEEFVSLAKMFDFTFEDLIGKYDVC